MTRKFWSWQAEHFVRLWNKTTAYSRIDTCSVIVVLKIVVFCYIRKLNRLQQLKWLTEESFKKREKCKYVCLFWLTKLGGGGGVGASSLRIEPGDALCMAVEWCRAIGQGHRCKLMHCREPKTGHQKVQLYYEDDTLCPYSYFFTFCISFYQLAGDNNNEQIIMHRILKIEQ